MAFVFSIKNEEDFLFCEFLSLITWAKSFKDNKVILWTLYLDDIYNSIIYINRKRKFLFTQLTINLFILDNDMSFDSFHCLIPLEPGPQTLEMNSSHGSRTMARWDHWIKVLVIVVLNCVIIV
jgi:hypothetical protein